MILSVLFGYIGIYFSFLAGCEFQTVLIKRGTLNPNNPGITFILERFPFFIGVCPATIALIFFTAITYGIFSAIIYGILLFPLPYYYFCLAYRIPFPRMLE